MNNRILIVEDELKLANLLKDYLVASEFDCDIVLRGDEAMAAFSANNYQFVLLDLMLPGIDGLTLCRQIRQVSAVPIIILTAKVEEIDRLLGLELGADDYICKPYSPREVVARVKAVLRRVVGHDIEPVNSEIMIEQEKMRVSWQGSDLQFTAIEFNLFSVMYHSPSRIYNRDQLMQAMYQDNRVVSPRSIDSHIKKLRKKINVVTNNQDWVKSVYGVGYKFER